MSGLFCYQDILIDWAAAGVDGFVIRDAHSLVESHHLKDEPLSYMQDTSPVIILT